MTGRVLGGLMAAWVLWSGAAAASALCPVPPGADSAATGLVHSRAALAAGHPLTVVAMGSSSTEGVGATTITATYPAQLDAILEQRHATSAIQVLNKGIGGETAGANLVRFDKDVLAAKPDLVVWQVGTNDSFQKVPLDAFAATLRDGIARIRKTGADVILMNPQSFPGEAKVESYPAYASTVVALGRELDVPVLDRYRIMAWWLESRHFAADQVLSTDGLHLKDLSYRCLAEFVADMIDTPRVVSEKTAAR
ncbi:lysophospholipase L1-like esterase [Azospirillum brasilense]|uniref:Lysophospholipase L1-like esterase n=1 Tax=Azospirillum brasilense TaxID=192 RepID=A0A560BYA3_AZOBR|nr:GDSL-type esterase/lipase family protein [Azospirillum brasilense]MBK3731667.1 lipolytic protein G-D-S-L family [Azospirillum brasilense]TWA77588.1 lysophospholipase L1-like esterase [Azospirillum brasilense]